MLLAVPSGMATMTLPAADIARTDFDEAPGMRLTLEQARRLWGLDTDMCRRVLERLVANDFLVRDADGCYGRADRLDGVASSD
jgi:hypothetical protein